MAIAAAGISAAGILGGATAAPAATDKSKGRKGKMKILVLTGSPRKNDNSATLVEHFIKWQRHSRRATLTHARVF